MGGASNEGLSCTLVIIYLSDIISKRNNSLLLRLSFFGQFSLNILMIHCVSMERLVYGIRLSMGECCIARCH